MIVLDEASVLSTPVASLRASAVAFPNRPGTGLIAALAPGGAPVLQYSRSKAGPLGKTGPVCRGSAPPSPDLHRTLPGNPLEEGRQGSVSTAR